MLNKIRKIDIPATLLVFYVARLIILGTNIAEAITVFAICGLYAFRFYFRKRKEDEFNSVVAEINKIKDTVSAISMSHGLRRDDATKTNQKPQGKFF